MHREWIGKFASLRFAQPARNFVVRSFFAGQQWRGEAGVAAVGVCRGSGACAWLM